MRAVYPLLNKSDSKPFMEFYSQYPSVYQDVKSTLPDAINVVKQANMVRQSGNFKKNKKRAK